jgi:magnesium chelatase family protein
MAALVGGGLRARPGEISLAHHGVLFLDELPEFHPQVLDSLRQPLETGDVVIARANARVTYPARFQLIAAMNPCRCGLAGSPGFTCRRGARCAADYQERLSGPLLDRFDLTVEVAAVSANDLLLPQRKSEPSTMIARRVAMAREAQAARFQSLARPDLLTNSAMPASLIEELAMPDAAGLQLLSEAASVLKLSARGYHRVLKVARTIADLDQAEEVGRIHVAEALGYRGRREQMAAAA